ncbi:hypothetical protein BVH01_10420 [Pseudomonas sp. PA1(2017)]|nr:hypothetical protein BVH01_10420 [Pseudomonas sp. PA1(2017)]
MKNLGEKKLYAMTHSAEQVKQRFKLKPGYKEVTRPLQWVQFDHTKVDLMVVDEDDRTVVLGRPYISVAIDLYSRVILGFYVSLLSPSAVSVGMLMESCVLSKKELLQRLGLPEHLLPFSGLPEVIHTDNAKEFISDVFVLNAKEFDINVVHRDIPQKHQGGHIESLIGKIMLKNIHPLPGTTGSNPVERKHLNSEKEAAIGLNGLRTILAYHIHSYHNMVHSGIGDTPANVWNEWCEKNDNKIRSLDPKLHTNFKYRFYPEMSKPIVVKGIEMMRRYYSSSDLADKVGDRVVVKYDPYDLGHIFVNLNGDFKEIPCVRNPFNRSSDYETYQWGRHGTQKARAGTMTKEGAQSYAKTQSKVKKEVSLTAEEKKQKKREQKRQKGEEDYRSQANVNAADTPIRNDQPTGKKGSKPKPKKPSQSKYSVRLDEFTDQSDAVDFDQPPTFYDTNKS